jgi:uncharacterized membrane protein (Fun14 family)
MIIHTYNIIGGAAMKYLVGALTLALLIVLSLVHSGVITVNYQLLDTAVWSMIDWFKVALATVLISSYYSQNAKKQP